MCQTDHIPTRRDTPYRTLGQPMTSEVRHPSSCDIQGQSSIGECSLARSRTFRNVWLLRQFQENRSNVASFRQPSECKDDEGRRLVEFRSPCQDWTEFRYGVILRCAVGTVRPGVALPYGVRAFQQGVLPARPSTSWLSLRVVGRHFYFYIAFIAMPLRPILRSVQNTNDVGDVGLNVVHDHETGGVPTRAYLLSCRDARGAEIPAAMPGSCREYAHCAPRVQACFRISNW